LSIFAKGRGLSFNAQDFFGSTLNNKYSLEKKHARHLWLTPVILATQEAEIRRISNGSQPGQIV
jgi:hypothetical protein